MRTSSMVLVGLLVLGCLDVARAEDARWIMRDDRRWEVRPDVRFEAEPVVEAEPDAPLPSPPSAPPALPPLFPRETVAPDTPPLLVEFYQDPTREKGLAFLAWRERRDQAIDVATQRLQDLVRERQGTPGTPLR